VAVLLCASNVEVSLSGKQYKNGRTNEATIRKKVMHV